MEKIKYTKADKYTDLETILSQIETTDFDIPALIEFVQTEKAALARKATKAKETAAAKKTELDELAVAVRELLTAEPATRDEIFNLIEDEDATVAKVGARLNKLVALGYAVKTEVACTTSGGKKGTRMAYAIAEPDAE